MRCFECGEENPQDSEFCRKCGRRLTISAENITADVSDNTADVPQDAYESAGNTAENTAEDTAENTENTAGAAENESRQDTPKEEFVDGAYRYSIYDKDKKFVYCSMCGEKLSPDVRICPICGYEMIKKDSKKKIVIAAAVVLAALLLVAAGLFTAVDEMTSGIEGSWMVQEDSTSIFGLISGSYMVVDDDSIEYYSAFSSVEYDYTYNPITKTLTLCDDVGNEERLHLKWIDEDTFVIRESGDMYTRVSDFDDGMSEDESESSI